MEEMNHSPDVAQYFWINTKCVKMNRYMYCFNNKFVHSTQILHIGDQPTYQMVHQCHYTLSLHYTTEQEKANSSEFNFFLLHIFTKFIQFCTQFFFKSWNVLIRKYLKHIIFRACNCTYSLLLPAGQLNPCQHYHCQHIHCMPNHCQPNSFSSPVTLTLPSGKRCGRNIGK